MVILDVIVIILIAIGALSGHKKGLVGIVVGFTALILSIVLAFVFQSTVADAIYNTGIGEKISQVTRENMQKMIDNGESIDNSIYGKILSSNVTGDNIVLASENISRFVTKGLSFIVIFLLVRIICYILQMILNIVFDLPILSSINGVGGTIVGGLSVVIKIWVFLALLSFLSPLPACEKIFDCINQTWLVKLLYENNLLVNVIKSGLKIN